MHAGASGILATRLQCRALLAHATACVLHPLWARDVKKHAQE